MLSEFSKLTKPHPTKGANKRIYYSRALKNQHNNRYQYVLPYDQYNLSKEYYINASLVLNSYIATQAPLPHTFKEFWKMIWENDVSVIVMLTKFLEKRKVKAHCYWPNEINESVTIGDITVTLLDFQEDDSISYRYFELSYENETKKVHHLHYTGWADFDVPSDPSEFLKLVDMVEVIRRQNLGKKICVHCSAGLGRTGVFIAVHQYLLEYYDYEEPDVFDIVNDIREYRGGLVQTEEQYEFIHTAVNQYIKKNPRVEYETDDKIYYLDSLTEEEIKKILDSMEAPNNNNNLALTQSWEI